MRSAFVAEWIVGHFTDKNKAASIVGDLVEIKPQKGSFWFWLSVLGVVLSLTKRQHIAVIAAFLAAYWVIIALNAWSTPPFDWHPHKMTPWDWAYVVATTSYLMGWMALVYTAIRYGFSDELTHYTLVWTAIMTALSYGWQQPLVWTLCIILTLCAIAACVIWARWRRAALTLFASMIAGCVCFTMSGFVVFWYHSLVFRPGMIHGKMHWEFYSFLAVIRLTSLMCTYAAAVVCSGMHRWLVEADAPQLAE